MASALTQSPLQPSSKSPQQPYPNRPPPHGSRRRRRNRYDPSSEPEQSGRSLIEEHGRRFCQSWSKYVADMAALNKSLLQTPSRSLPPLHQVPLEKEKAASVLNWEVPTNNDAVTYRGDAEKEVRRHLRRKWVRKRKREELVYVEAIEAERKKRREAVEKARREKAEKLAKRKKREEEERLKEVKRKEEQERQKVELQRKRREKEAEEKKKKVEMEERKKREREKSEGLKEIGMGGTEMPQDVMKCIEALRKARDVAKPFIENVQTKPQRKALRKRINITINQISLSQKSVREKTAQLMGLLNESSSLGTSAQTWVAVRIVERLVASGESTVSVASASAFSIASVIDGLIKQVQQFHDLFLAEFCISCPFCAAVYPTKKAGESKEEYQRRLGFKEEEEGTSYVERMTGYLALYAACLQMGTFGTERAWKWFKTMVEGRAGKVSAPLLATFLDVAGYEMARFFGDKFSQLLRVMVDKMGPGKIKNAKPGPASRLQKWCEAYGRGQIEFPKGKDLPVSDAENR